MPIFRSGEYGQQLCRRQALHSNNPTLLFVGLLTNRTDHERAREGLHANSALSVCARARTRFLADSCNVHAALLSGRSDPMANKPNANKIFTLTVNQDTIIAKGAVIVNGPLVGGAPTLTNLDSIVVTGPHSEDSVLNAFFNGDATANGVNIDGIPTWNITTAGAGTVSINTASGLIRGLTNLNFNGTGGSSRRGGLPVS